MEIRVQSRPVVVNQRDQAIEITFRSDNQLAIIRSAQNQPDITAHVYRSLTMLAMPRKFACTLHMLSADRGDPDPDAFFDPSKGS